jgi:D-3-phosphoglycerate dehydrogenase / 2-oxoglutarate reductase
MSAFKVVITDFSDPDCNIEREVLEASGLDINLVRLQTKVPAELIPQVADADALIVQWATINRDVIEALQHCKVISRYGIGVDMVDLAAAGEYGVFVANVPDFCIEEVSLQTIGFLIDLNRHTWGQHAYVRAGQWGQSPMPLTPPRRLSTQTLGIVGLGNIGRMVAQRAGGLGLKMLGYDPYVKPELLDGLGIEMVGLEDLLRRSDYVSLHCPLVPETRHLMAAPQLAMMKPTAYLINMARGPVCEQAALYAALAKGIIAGAALDVLDPEPPRPDDPLLQLPNVIVTPHASSWSLEAGTQLRRDTAQNVVDALKGQMPRSVVNRAALRI